MRKRLICLVMFLLVAIIMVGCTEESYELRQSTDKIVSIEIIVAESKNEYTIIKELSDSEIRSFTEALGSIRFRSYYGTPRPISGNAIKITYKDGNYELICANTAEYMKDGYIFYIVLYCDEAEFDDFLAKYVDKDALRKYYDDDFFEFVVVGQHTYQDICEIAPTDYVQTTSYGIECRYYLKRGGYILMKFYGDDLIVGTIEKGYTIASAPTITNDIESSQ